MCGVRQPATYNLKAVTLQPFQPLELFEHTSPSQFFILFFKIKTNLHAIKMLPSHFSVHAFFHQ